MTGFEAYQLYISLKNHFSKSSYDFFKYAGKSKLKYDSYLSRKDKVFFEKLSKHYDLKTFLVANFVLNPKLWVRDLAYSKDCEDVYQQWVQNSQSVTYRFKNALNLLNDNFDSNFIVEKDEHPQILKLFLSDDIKFDIFIILIDIVNCESYFNKQMKDDPIWKVASFKMNKVKPFIKYDKAILKNICIDKFS